MINKKKRVRTSFKHQQLRIMKAHFQINQNPDSKDLKELSERTGLQKRVLQVWFQNSRAKQRKSNGPCGLSINGMGSLSNGMSNMMNNKNVSADSSVNLDDDEMYSEEEDDDDEEMEEDMNANDLAESEEEDQNDKNSHKLPIMNPHQQQQHSQQQIHTNSLIDFYCY
jgi:hypothetical protein